MRDEHWVVISGQAEVTLDGKQLFLATGESLDIPVRSAHRLMNPGNDLLVIIEIQSGKSFLEEDIERLEDDFGRAN